MFEGALKCSWVVLGALTLRYTTLTPFLSCTQPFHKNGPAIQGVGSSKHGGNSTWNK